MKKRLYKSAIISAPIIAAIASAPLYVIEHLQIQKLLLLWLTLTCVVFVFWFINIYLILKIKKNNSYKRYLLSYLLVTITQAFNIYIVLRLQLNPPNESLLLPFVPATGINTIILILANSIVLQFQKESAEIEVEQLKVQNLEAQKQMLLQQLQPHFLFNALSTLKSLISEDQNLAMDYTVRLADFLRYSVQAKDIELVSLSEELKFTTDYIELQKVRFGDSLCYHIDILDINMVKQVPIYALQTLVENAIKHNAFSDKKPLMIHITVEADHLTLCNNRVAKRLNIASGTGLRNLNQRYQMIANTDIKVIESDTHFIVHLKLI